MGTKPNENMNEDEGSGNG